MNAKRLKDWAKVAAVGVVAVSLAEAFGIMDKVRGLATTLRAKVGI
jgi:hypothetical protein